MSRSFDTRADSDAMRRREWDRCAEASRDGFPARALETSEDLRALLAWNDPNGDYATLAEEGLATAFAYQCDVDAGLTSTAPHDEHYPERIHALRLAAQWLSHAVNALPHTDGTDPDAELDALRYGDAPSDYLDDLQARVGVNVDDARAMLTLATCDAAEFPDTWNTIASRYPDLLP